MSVKKSLADADWGRVEMAEAGLVVTVPRVITTTAKPALVRALLLAGPSLFFHSRRRNRDEPGNEVAACELRHVSLEKVSPECFCNKTMGAFFWEYSGKGILGIDGICVLLGAIPFSE